MKKKTILTLSIMLVVLGGSAMAAWLLSTSATISGHVISSGQDVLVMEFSNQDMGLINTTEGAVTVNSSNNLINGNGDLELMVGFDTVVVDFDDECNATGDLETSLFIDGVEKFDGDMINISSGNTPVVLVADLVPHACDSNFTSLVSFTEV